MQSKFNLGFWLVSYNFFSLLNLWGLPGDVTAVHTCLLLLPPALLSVELPAGSGRLLPH
jgi:hypothetical protein